MAAANKQKIKSLFGDLGKATLRGVRKCPKCGTYNGTRGISCKNKACDVVFKERERKRGHSADAVKIHTGNTNQVYSVRLRDRGPDYRGFVQLPLVQDSAGNPATLIDNSLLIPAARCFVESCSRNSSQSNTLGETRCCPHIKAAIECNTEAQPLTLKSSVLNALQVSAEMQQEIWDLASDLTGPVVQRVTKNIMVVKCKPSAKQPLGFLHFAFFESNRNRPHPDYRFHCSCKTFRNTKTGTGSKDDSHKRCVHFYACICAFSSEEKLSEEFAFYISLDAQASLTRTLSTKDDTDKESLQAAVFHISDESSSCMNALDAPAAAFLPSACKEEGDKECSLITVYQAADDSSMPPDTGAVEVIVKMEEDEDLLEGPAKKKRKEDMLAQASSALLTLQEVPHQPQVVQVTMPATPPRKTSPTKALPQKTSTAAPKKNVTASPIDEGQVSFSFYQWLASVTERINQAMHYQFPGTPDPLVFHAPQVFFDCLQQRISAGSKKKRLPNFTTAFLRKDALPLGTFTKYTWHITNLGHVKQIFETPEMPLDISRNFVENRDGTYDLYEVPKVQVENIDETYKGKNQTPIRPFELKTFLKVGNTTADQKEPTPFIIEWIPDILPKTHIGELRIKFEYGHQRNGQIEHRVPPQSSDLPIQTITLQEV